VGSCDPVDEVQQHAPRGRCCQWTRVGSCDPVDEVQQARQHPGCEILQIVRRAGAHLLYTAGCSIGIAVWHTECLVNKS